MIRHTHRALFKHKTLFVTKSCSLSKAQNVSVVFFFTKITIERGKLSVVLKQDVVKVVRVAYFDAGNAPVVFARQGLAVVQGPKNFYLVPPAQSSFPVIEVRAVLSNFFAHLRVVSPASIPQGHFES